MIKADAQRVGGRQPRVGWLLVVAIAALVCLLGYRWLHGGSESAALDDSAAYGQLSRWAAFAVIQPTASCLPATTRIVATSTATDLVDITYAPANPAATYDVYESPPAHPWTGLTRQKPATGTVRIEGQAWTYWQGSTSTLTRTFSSGTHVALSGADVPTLLRAALAFNCSG